MKTFRLPLGFALLSMLAVGPGVIAIIIVTLHEKIAAAVERRSIRGTLGKLDDYMLKDMGISRSNIERIANRTYPPR